MRILYLADIRFPLERANGIQSMATCHALASHGHVVTMVVRPDTHSPPLDPFVFYGVPPIERLRIEVAPLTGPPAARRAGYLTYAIARSLGRARQDLIFTRDLMVASLVLRLPVSLRAPLAYEAHGIAADSAAALPELLTAGPRASRAKLRRLERRDARVWHAADAYVTITEGLARELIHRFGERPRVAVVPDGVRLTTEHRAPVFATDRPDHTSATDGASLTSATDHTGHTDRMSATDHTDDTDRTSATDHTDHTDRTSATDHTDHTDRTSATDHTDHTDRTSATDHTDHTDRTSATDHTDHTDRTSATDHKDHTDQRAFTIGYAGHLYPWKGAHLVIEAIAALTDTRGLIIGGHEREDDLARLRALVDQLDCNSRVTFTGRVAPVDVAPLLKQADVLILPNPVSAISTAFTSPLKLFEYMAAGRPIVASDLPSIREVLTDGHNALLVEPGNPQALTAAVRRLKEDPETAARLSHQALEDVREYTWDRRAARLESLFTQAIEASA